MITIKELILKYRQLPRQEKERIGAALVKVNMGVSLPLDQQMAAVFLKGSTFIAKSGTLDELIEKIHQDGKKDEERERRVGEQENRGTGEKRTGDLTEQVQKELIRYREDSEPTTMEDHDRPKR